MLMQRTIKVVERDGFLRRSFPCTTVAEFGRGLFRPGDPSRLFDPAGKEQPVQVDVVRSWEDGSVRTAAITLPVTLPARGEGACRFEYGDGATPAARLRNPVVVRTSGEPIEVQQGPVTCRVRRQGFNLVDQVVFNDRAFLRPGARGAVLVLKDGQELCPEGETRVTVETQGPWSARLRAEGAYPGGYRFITALTFVSGKSWLMAEHEVVSGDVAQVASVVVEADFNLPAGPLSTAFGARRRADGRPTSWVVVTDGVLTVDAATVGAWSETGSVRHEVEPDGRFRAIFPFESRSCVTYFHYLLCPPDDVNNTPAAAMAADPECRVILM